MTAGIAVPVFIHLWRRRPGKVLKVGSVQLLQAASVRHARSTRISEWWLLLLRCLLILLLALLLSAPVWQQSIDARSQRGWVLVEKGAYPHFQHTVDSLLQAGYRLHNWDTSFGSTNVQSLSGIDTAQIPYWQLLTLLQEKVPPDLPLYLFTGNRLSRFSGARPELALQLHWSTYTPADSITHWNAYTYPVSKDSVYTITGAATPTGVTYTGKTAAGSDSGICRISIFADNNADAAYVAAALQALQQYTRRNMQVEVVTAAAQLPPSPNWLWWLSEKSLPPGVKALHTVRYAPGKPQYYHAYLQGSDIAVNAHIPANDSAALWRDSYGNSLLSANGNDYTLYTHIHPSWTEMPWSSVFPQYLLPLFFPEQDTLLQDRRQIAPDQIMPAQKEPGNTNKSFTVLSSLEQPCWILLLLVFCMERYLSARRKKEDAHE